MGTVWATSRAKQPQHSHPRNAIVMPCKLSCSFLPLVFVFIQTIAFECQVGQVGQVLAYSCPNLCAFIIFYESAASWRWRLRCSGCYYCPTMSLLFRLYSNFVATSVREEKRRGADGAHIVLWSCRAVPCRVNEPLPYFHNLVSSYQLVVVVLDNVTREIYCHCHYDAL